MYKRKNEKRTKIKIKKPINLQKSKRIKNYKESNIEKKKFFKKLFIIILLFIYICIHYISKIENESNYDWRKNTKKLINKQISILNGHTFKEFKDDLDACKFYFAYPDYNDKADLVYKNNVKKKLIKIYSKRYRKDFRYIKNIAINKPFSFGNQIAAINNLMYYCEILGIKNIYFNSKHDFYLKNNIITDKLHILLISEDEYKCSSIDTFCGDLSNDFYYPKEFRPKRMSLILNNEIKRNLPQISINKNDLYIYIRSGDLFAPEVNNGYIPYPYCFYEKVITKFNFSDIYIISLDTQNPVIGKLISSFPKIKHHSNDVKLDISILINAYNLVNSMSSFTQAAISFNDNLENLFDYEVYKGREAILHFHYDIDKLNRIFNIYRMKPSENYFRNMYNWRNLDKQRKMMIEENCINDLIKTIY